MKIYFAAALGSAPEEFRKEISDLKDSLRKDFELLDFVGFRPDLDPKVIYKHDSDCVKACDIIIAECSHPSTGVGYEIGLALSLEKKVIALAKDGIRISAMISGNPQIETVYYKDLKEVLEILKKEIYEKK